MGRVRVGRLYSSVQTELFSECYNPAPGKQPINLLLSFRRCYARRETLPAANSSWGCPTTIAQARRALRAVFR
jgi:hypothetical protein